MKQMLRVLVGVGLLALAGSPALLAQRGAPPVVADDALAAKVRVELAAARKLPSSLDKIVTPVVDNVWSTFDTAKAFDQVKFMDQYWRLAGNEGFDKSMDRVKARLVSAGFEELPSRPDHPLTKPSLWYEPAPQPSLGWDQQKATLAIVSDGKPDQVVISREKERLALEINSFSTAPGGVTAPLIDIGGGGTAADYNGKDVKGAVVLGTAGAGQLFTQAVVNRGAIGVVSMSPLPGYLDKNPDILQWGSISYDEAHKGFAFRATARAGAALKVAAALGNARVHADVATTFSHKPERTLSAEIPGAIRPDERIVVAAHVQEPGANDNASGTATNMELARALVMGVTSGKIPKPARTLTFLWVNEISGSRRWLSEHPDQKAGVKYMFSMDMTGEDITQTGGHFLIERWPDPGAVWARSWDPHTEWGASQVRADSLKGDLINDLHMAICERVSAKAAAAIKKPWDVRSNPYEGGSDHTQFGSAGIPSVLDWHFTDRFYHTNQDTFEKTSPEEMRNVGTAVATSAWLMASGTSAIAADVKNLITKVGDARVAVERREGAAVKAAVDNTMIVEAWIKWYAEAAASSDRLIVTPMAKTPADLLQQEPADLRALEAWTRGHRGQKLSGDAMVLLRRSTTVGSTATPRDRRLAAQTLQNLGDNDEATILKIVTDADWQVRRIGVPMLSTLGLDGAQANTKAVAAFERLLADADFHVRIDAVKLAGRSSARSGNCTAISHALNDQNPAVVIQALDSVPARCSTPTGIATEVQQLAGAIGSHSTVVPVAVSTHAIGALTKVAPDLAATLVDRSEYFSHPVWQVRAAVATAAGAVRSDARLKIMAGDRTPNVRTAVLAAMDAMHSDALVTAAVDALTSTEPQLVREAARRLKGATDDRVVPALMASLRQLTAQGKDTSRDPRLAVFERLQELASPTMAPAIRAYLKDYDPQVAAAAGKLLTKLTPAEPAVVAPSLRPAVVENTRNLPKTATITMADGGVMTLALLGDVAPMTVARFARLARAGYYDGLTFHRVVLNFVIQGGSPDANEYLGDARFMPDELGDTSHVRGAVGISTRGRDTGDAQIFIDLVDVPRLDHDYTVFAQITSGLDVMDRVLDGASIRSVVVK